MTTLLPCDYGKIISIISIIIIIIIISDLLETDGSENINSGF